MTRTRVSLILAVPLIAGILFFAAGLPLVNARRAWLSGDVIGALQALRRGRFGIRAADYNRARAAIALSDGNAEAANSALANLSGESAPWLPVFTKDVVGRKLLAAGKYQEFLRFDRVACDWQKTSESWLIRSAAEAGMGDISGAQAAFGKVQAGDVERSRYETLRTALAERAEGVFPLLLDRNGTPIAEWNSKTDDLRATNSDFEAFVDRSGGARTVESTLTAPLRQFTMELTLDPFVQRAALSALGTNRGSLVAIDTATNEILAIANSGGEGVATDLALDGDYEPGSVIKVLTALNGVESGVDLSGFFPRQCEGSQDIDGRIFHDWQRHGQVGDLNRALAVSCNIAFGELGLQIGKERLLSFMTAAGFGQMADLGLLRAPLGRIDGPVEGLYDTASLAIGLEKERINALHVAILASMVANRGVMTIPRLVRSRRTILGDVLPLPPGTPPRRIASDAAAAAVTEAMRAVVEANDGTGKRAAVSGFPIVMKTGTAGEGAHGFNSVILAFAPADRPRIAIGMISEHTGPAEFVGAKIAHDFFQSVGAWFRQPPDGGNTDSWRRRWSAAAREDIIGASVRGEVVVMEMWNVYDLDMAKNRRKYERYPTPSVPVQLSDVDGELIDLSLQGAAVVHRSPINSGSPCTLVFPTYGGIYIPCQVLRSIVQVRRGRRGPEYVFRSAIMFLPMAPEQRQPLHEFIELQMKRLNRSQATA